MCARVFRFLFFSFLGCLIVTTFVCLVNIVLPEWLLCTKVCMIRVTLNIAAQFIINGRAQRLSAPFSGAIKCFSFIADYFG